MPRPTSIKSVLIGTPVTARGTFRNVDDVLADPANILVTVLKPNGHEATFHTADMTHVSTGVWTVIIGTDQVGQYVVNVAGSGNSVDVDNEASFLVRARRT